MLNLEPRMARAAMSMVEGANSDAEKLFRRAVLVLSEQGLFAFGLFLASRKKADELRLAKHIHRKANDLLGEMGLAPEVESPEKLTAEYYKSLVSSRQEEADADALYRILISQRVLEQTLAYAIFYAKNA